MTLKQQLKKFLKGNSRRDASFTLIELVIVIGILAILAVVVIIVLNPSELLRQARDSNRLSDLQTINSAIAQYQADGGTSLGQTNKVYVSIPSSQGNCSDLGLPTLPDNWFYSCSDSGNYRKVDSNGWIPVNLTSISFGSSLDILPIDPINATSSGNYYTYVTGGSWELTTSLESEKYFKNTLKDGGYDASRLELGSNLTLWNQALGTEIIVNGDMESASGGLTNNWGNGGCATGICTASDAESENVINGLRSQKLYRESVNHSYFRQGFSVVCNTNYRASMVYQLNANGSNVFLGVYDISGGGQGQLFSQNLISDNKLHHLIIYFTVPSNCAGTAYTDAPRMEGSTGTVYIDEVSIRRR